MLNQSKSRKFTALALASTMLSVGLLPTQTSFAHERHNPNAHNSQGHNWNKRAHRGFHNHYGRGIRGEEAFQRELRQNRRANKRANQHRKNKRDKRGDLIAAGIIGLAVGAIIADSASKNKNSRAGYNYNQPQYEPRRYQEPVRSRYNQPKRSYDEPQVIRYQETISYEPWSSGWLSWCKQNYRSFNQSRGTFRGYDGQDHFCVVK